ncbi:MAG: glycosyltransferase family 1 protein [Saprospiraceae bacterium]
MKIAVNTRFLLPQHLEGIGRFTWEVGKRLAARYPQHTFLFLFDRPYDARFVPTDNVVPIVVNPPARHPLLWYLWFEWAIPRVLARHQADVFLSMDGYCSLAAKTPTVMVAHDIAFVHYPGQIPALVRRYYRFFAPRYLQRADALLTVSDFCRTDIAAQYHIPASDIGLTCNAASPVFQPLSEQEQRTVREEYNAGRPYFFYVGAVHPRKNLVRLIAAFDQFKTQTGAEVDLLIGGRMAWQTGDIKWAWDAAHHRQNIRFLGYISDETLPKITAAAFGLVYVSLFEGFGVPLLEAMQAGVPVITSNVTSLPEVAGDAAVLVNPTDVAAIAEAMQQLWEEDDLRQTFVQKGLLRAQYYTWERATDAVAQAIRTIVTL